MSVSEIHKWMTASVEREVFIKDYEMNDSE